MSWPSIGVVVPTRGGARPLPETLAAIEEQDYPGRLRTVVVYDAAASDWLLAHSGARPRMVLGNWRGAGPAGARNTGVLALDTDLVAFCDDNDEWRPGKLRAQVLALAAAPEAELATTAIEVEYEHRSAVRRLRPDRVGSDRPAFERVPVDGLLRARPAALHPSTFLIRRAALLGPLGLLAEDAPGGQNDAWDLLLRAARRAPLVHVDEPHVLVRWPHTSARAVDVGLLRSAAVLRAGGPGVVAGYERRIASLRWMMARHPEIVGYPPGAAHVYGKLACWSAAAGERSQAWRYARAAVRHNWREPRVAIAVAAATGLVRVESILAILNRRGRGI